MANNRIVITGIEDFKRLPRELRDSAAPIVRAGAEEAVARVRSAYPRITGRLQDGVRLRPRSASDPAEVVYTVESTAPYALIYEFGAASGKGQRARPTFLPITGRSRRETTDDVIDLVEQAGLTVRGNAD
jgi:phage gpG-like protein